MGSEKVLFKTEEKMSRSDVATLLRTLADKVEKGKVSLEQGKEQVDLKIPNQVELEIKAVKKKTKKKLEIEIEWSVGDDSQDKPLTLG
jgi:amphi-Trp domain-containing protein